MRRKTEPVEKTQEELADLIAEERFDEIDKVPLLTFDPAEAEDYEHLEELENSHGFRCIEHRLREKAVYANAQALQINPQDMGGRLQAFYTGVFQGMRDALATRIELMAQAKGEQLTGEELTPPDLPPKKGSKALLFPKPTQRKRSRSKKA